MTTTTFREDTMHKEMNDADICYFFYQLNPLGKRYPTKSTSHPLVPIPEKGRPNNIRERDVHEITWKEFKEKSLTELAKEMPCHD